MMVVTWRYSNVTSGASLSWIWSLAAGWRSHATNCASVCLRQSKTNKQPAAVSGEPPQLETDEVRREPCKLSGFCP